MLKNVIFTVSQYSINYKLQHNISRNENYSFIQFSFNVVAEIIHKTIQIKVKISSHPNNYYQFLYKLVKLFIFIDQHFPFYRISTGYNSQTNILFHIYFNMSIQIYIKLIKNYKRIRLYEGKIDFYMNNNKGELRRKEAIKIRNGSVQYQIRE